MDDLSFSKEMICSDLAALLHDMARDDVLCSALSTAFDRTELSYLMDAMDKAAKFIGYE